MAEVGGRRVGSVRPGVGGRAGDRVERAVGGVAGGRADREAPLRLTRRGRLVVAVLCLLGVAVALAGVGGVVVGLSSVAAPPAAAGAAVGGPVADPTVAEVVVAPGETVWELARRHAPDRDPREVVAEVERVNGLPSGGLVEAGTVLLVPRR